ncbi:MAG: hypothetical protein GX316_10660 [Firmicutes bacterium]|nr:hypothetical protein [Bacillota bacterium]
MRKLTMALVAALILSLAAPALAADINLGGSLETEFEFGPKEGGEEWKDWTVTPDSGISMKLDVKAGDKVKVGLEFGKEEVGLDDGDLDDAQTDITGLGTDTNLNIQLKKAYLETTGAFWNGGPELTTTIGDVDVDFNDYIANLEGHNGIKVEGMELGPVNAQAFYATKKSSYTIENEEDKLEEVIVRDAFGGLNLGAGYAGIELDATVVTDGDEIEAAGSAGTEISGVKVKAEAAVNRESTLAYKLSGETELMPNVTIKGSYRDNEDFRSVNAKLDDGDPVAYDEHKGFNVGVATTQYGVNMEADYDMPKQELKFAADSNVEVVGLDVKGEYNAKYRKDEAIEHKVKVSSGLNMVPQLQGLEVNAGTTINKDHQDGQNTWNVGAGYEAPNGMNFGAKYESDKGPSAHAGLKVEF